jgi:hypothetical protein
MGPEGISDITGPEFPLPNERAFCSIAKVDGKILRVGQRKELRFDLETELMLGPNDEPGKIGEGFADNRGHWSYKICIPTS